MKDIFLKYMFNTQKNYVEFIMTYQKLLTHLYNSEWAIHIRNLKQALNLELILKKVHRVIRFNQKGGLKPAFDMNPELRQKADFNFCYSFFFFFFFFLSYCKHIANSPFWKLCECLTIPIKIILSIYSKISCLSVCKKINFITRFFKILQRNSKLVILGNLDMPGCTHPKW